MRTSLLVFAAAMLLTVHCDADEQCADGSHVVTSPSIRVVTLNAAHGRKDGKNQMFLKQDVIRNNLVTLGELLDRADAHVIALQEADAASSWSGKFDHVDFLTHQSRYVCSFHGIHARNTMYDFGTALLSPYPFQGSFAHSFEPSWPTTTKGFSVAALDWNPDSKLDEPLKLKFVSVHLDFSRRSVRRSQIDEMVKLLSGIDGPIVVMGDFNTDWQSENSSLQYLAQQLELSVFKPQSEGLSTYGNKGARLDWILISDPLDFLEYAVFPDVISDHYAVAAELILKE